ncbi:hypothetical protein [Bradyrhizobium manausense]|uniref:Uncharacterized protein n=1 Tax=Bradyrhizobium manausense TaxID=989370 RepID=A0A0R3E8S0_9BRAD|nr:hypothetical protein [Bradyrhizobium manausense]KRQ15551.1 hypothetical protein AOQ71_09205 [Bradyrhizobium manausense]
MKITFDSNSWEQVFDPSDREWEPVQSAISTGRITGFICEAGFRIEAIRKRERAAYFAEPAMAVQSAYSTVVRNGKPCIPIMSFGPNDAIHPGLPEMQAPKLKAALAAGVRLMRGLAWLGLPSPGDIRDPALFVQTSDPEREQRQIDAAARIEARGVGKAAFDAAGGWNAHPGTSYNEKVFAKACAEWADGELVASHIAYRNDILCTNDLARAAGTSIFDPANRAWRATEFGVQFVTLAELLKLLST